MLQTIGSILPQSLRRTGIEKQVLSAQIIQTFHEELKSLFGPRVLKRVQAKYIRHKVLTVAVLNSVLVQEIRLHEGEIMAKINAKYKKILVERFRYLL